MTWERTLTRMTAGDETKQCISTDFESITGSNGMAQCISSWAVDCKTARLALSETSLIGAFRATLNGDWPARWRRHAQSTGKHWAEGCRGEAALEKNEQTSAALEMTRKCTDSRSDDIVPLNAFVAFSS